MRADHFHLSSDYVKEHRVLPLHVQKRVGKTLELFSQNPLHPSLRLHRLSGKWEGHWSLSITLKHRIIFKTMENDDVLLVSVGTHAIYD